MSDPNPSSVSTPVSDLLGELKITAIRTTPISVPMSFVYKWGPGTYEGFSRTLVEVDTSAGITGIGEAGYARDAALIDHLIAPKLIGADPLDLVDCERRAIPSYTGMVTGRNFTKLNAYSGVEIALWDIAGKATGRSVAQLIGGIVRDEVSFTEYFAIEAGKGDDFSAVAEVCRNAVAEYGATGFEGKVGVLPLHKELEMVGAVREAIGPDIPIRLDANMSWDVATAREALPKLADLGVTWVEEPVMTQAELIRLKGVSPISFSSHQIDLPLAARDGVPESFVVKLHYLGGIRRTVQFVDACSAFGIPVWFRSPSAGVETAAEIQIAAALAPMKYPSQNLSRWLGDEIIDRGPFHATNGVVKVPDGPGLGVTLDPVAVERCAERARQSPLNDAYAR
ncbi:MAG: mandelate racemase/muconate lactonizing enzyme family protein [Solirubrobacterales bacterium]